MAGRLEEKIPVPGMRYRRFPGMQNDATHCGHELGIIPPLSRLRTARRIPDEAARKNNTGL